MRDPKLLNSKALEAKVEAEMRPSALSIPMQPSTLATSAPRTKDAAGVPGALALGRGLARGLVTLLLLDPIGFRV